MDPMSEAEWHPFPAFPGGKQAKPKEHNIN